MKTRQHDKLGRRQRSAPHQSRGGAHGHPGPHRGHRGRAAADTEIRRRLLQRRSGPSYRENLYFTASLPEQPRGARKTSASGALFSCKEITIIFDVEKSLKIKFHGIRLLIVFI